MMEKKDKLYREIEEKLQSKDTKVVLSTLKELRHSGHAYLLPILFNLTNKSTNQDIKEEVFQILGLLKEKKCVNYLIDEIKSGRSNKNITRLVATCWQSGLDYSEHIKLFAEQFINGDYVTAIESFTVIEEWIHNSSVEDIKLTKEYLILSVSAVDEEKKPLYMELVKLVEDYI